MRVLGLDLGGTTGWAITGTTGTILASGTWDIAPRRGESPGCRYLHLRAQLAEMLAGHQDLELVVYEAAHHRGGAATEYGAGCAATVQAWCAEHRIEHTAVHTATLKKFATGKGNADKAAMVRAAIPHLAWFDVRKGTRQLDDNEADAIHLARYGVDRVAAESQASPMNPETPR